ncbi:MAG: tail fiber domain-containing protein [Bacteroidetes bacterium]|nr:tail fiber domain-containing protein [Bacteroidota bacterium]
MKKSYLRVAALLLLSTSVRAQNVAINSDGSLPNPNAALDIKSTTKGLLIPRMTANDYYRIPPVKGMLVYDTIANMFAYSNGGPSWTYMAPGGNGWGLRGNSYTRDSGYFLGTTDLAPLRMKVNNGLSGLLDADMRNSFWGHLAGANSVTSISQGARDSGNYPSLVAIGEQALYSNTTGSFNTATGASALYANTSGFYNTANGYMALRNNAGGSNTAVGAYSMQSNVNGYLNAAVGSYSLPFNVDGSYNTALGHQALYRNASDGNVGVGFNTLYNNVVGNYNVAVGYAAGANSPYCQNSTFIGSNTGSPGINIINATAIGAGATVDASNKVRIGNSAVTVIEGQVPFTTPSDGRLKYDVQEDVKGLDFVMKLRPVTYRFDVSRFDAGGGNPHTTATPANYAVQAAYREAAQIRRSGFIAQDVEKAAKASGYDFSGVIVPKTEQEHYSLSYESFVVPLVKAVQEQQKAIDALQHTIAELQKQIADIKQSVNTRK